MNYKLQCVQFYEQKQPCLFSNILNNEAHNNTSFKNLTKVLTFYVQVTHFQFGPNIYQQQESLVTGLPLSSMISNIYLDFFKVCFDISLH